MSARDEVQKARESAQARLAQTRSEAQSQLDSATQAARSRFDSATEAAASQYGSAKDTAASQFENVKEKTQSQLGSARATADSQLRSTKDAAGSQFSSAKETAEKHLDSASDTAEKQLKEARAQLGNASDKLNQQLRGISPSSSGLDLPEFTLGGYARFFMAGALCATITHGAMTPVDVVKTRLQLEPKGSKLGMASMARHIVASEGPQGLMTGFGPTAVGYLIQGGAKFCGFEYFKKRFAEMAGSREAAERNRTAIYIGGASAAELIASTLLTPLEAARIRLVSERGYAKGLVGAVTRMGAEGGLREFYAGYIPILFKQIPFTQAQFTINEYAHELFKTNVSQEKLESYGKTGQIGVSLTCGLAAGIGAAIASHPADTLLSKINKGGGGKGGSFTKMINLTRETGFSGLWAGLGTRIVMQAGLICAQMAIYDQLKIMAGAPPSVTISSDTSSH